MTAQISDQVEYCGEQFQLAAKSGSDIFDPVAHGLNPVGSCSACWRGYICQYVVDENELRLRDLDICLGREDQLRFKYGRLPLRVFGVAGTDIRKEGHRSFFDVRFVDINQRVQYTGGLLVAREFIRELYVHMGFHPAWKYRTVIELTFEEGRLLQTTDRSKQIAEFRSEVAHIPLKPGCDARSAEIKDWINRCFSQDYRW